MGPVNSSIRKSAPLLCCLAQLQKDARRGINVPYGTLPTCAETRLSSCTVTKSIAGSLILKTANVHTPIIHPQHLPPTPTIFPIHITVKIGRVGNPLDMFNLSLHHSFKILIHTHSIFIRPQKNVGVYCRRLRVRPSVRPSVRPLVRQQLPLPTTFSYGFFSFLGCRSISQVENFTPNLVKIG